LLKVDTFTLPNRLTETPLVPEFMQERATPESIAAAVLALLDDPARRAAIADRFATLRSELALDADRRAAEAVLSLVKDATGNA
jgi:lipid-A-disaccharide synthase